MIFIFRLSCHFPEKYNVERRMPYLVIRLTNDMGHINPGDKPNGGKGYYQQVINLHFQRMTMTVLLLPWK